MSPTATRSTLTYSSTSDGSAGRNQMRSAWAGPYHGCRVSLHEVFDQIPRHVETHQRTGETVVIGDLVEDIEAIGLSESAVIIVLGSERDEHLALTVMSDE